MAEQFHRSKARERLGTGSNRSSKTLSFAAEMSRALTGQDPYGKYPLRDGRAIIVGKDEREIGQVLYRKLFEPGAFKIIRDLDTNYWRTFRPWTADMDRRDEVRPAPPLIPERFIEHIGWKNKKEHVPGFVLLKTGWEAIFAASGGKPLKGADLDLAWLDEEVLNELWYEELCARMLDRHGRLMWSATPELATDQLLKIHERIVNGDADAVEFTFLLSDNPYIEESEKLLLEKQLSFETAETKIRGKYAFLGRRVYPEFNARVHSCPHFAIPPHWTRYMAVDPGTQVCAVLFLAVPPPADAKVCACGVVNEPESLECERCDKKLEVASDGFAGHFYIYDELYIRRCSASIFGEEVAKVAGGQTFEEFLIDHKSGNVQEIGCGRTIQDQYASALAQHKITSRITGSNFLWGSSDEAGRREMLRRWLEAAADGRPRLRIFEGRCLNLIHELEHYIYDKTSKGRIKEKQPRDRDDHAIWTLQALCARRPQYVKPIVKKKPTGAYRAYLAEQERERKYHSFQMGL